MIVYNIDTIQKILLNLNKLFFKRMHPTRVRVLMIRGSHH
jgi:hypothetical protein